MPVVIKYVVERDGIEKMTFTSKSEADAYDKLLDTADALYELIEGSKLMDNNQQIDALALYLAEHKSQLLEAVGNKRKTLSKSKKNVPDTNKQLDLKEASAKEKLDDIVIEPDEDALYENENDMSYEISGEFEADNAA
ncbi:YebG family protein [Marinomonas epiphytica]